MDIKSQPIGPSPKLGKGDKITIEMDDQDGDFSAGDYTVIGITPGSYILKGMGKSRLQVSRGALKDAGYTIKESIAIEQKLRRIIQEEVRRQLTLRESYRDQEMVINQPNYGSTPYGQAVAGRAIDSWDKLIAVLNSYDIHAEMSDDRRHLQQRRDVNAKVKEFLKTYSGPKSWSKLTDTGREALGIVGIR